MCEQEKSNRKTFAEIIKEQGLSDEQVKFYQQYSLERSRRAYEIVAAEELGSDELIEDWQYNGYYDAGYRGAEYCTAGHPLRYVHLAQNKKDGRIIKFGIKCVTDFFKLTPLQIKFIKNGFNEANREIQEGLDAYVQWQGDFDAYEEKYHYSRKLQFIIKNDPDKLYLASDSFMNLLKVTEAKTILKLRLFLPNYFAYAIDRAFRVISRTVEIVSEDNNEEVKNPHQDIFDYLKSNHPDAYKVANSLYNNSRIAALTEKQRNLFNKLMSTKWQEIDIIIAQVAAKQIKLRANYLDIFDSLTDQYKKWGMTEKQFQLMGKCLKVSK